MILKAEDSAPAAIPPNCLTNAPAQKAGALAFLRQAARETRLSADVLSFELGARILRGAEYETERKARIRERWQVAKHRAFYGEVSKGDLGLFGKPALERMRSPWFDGPLKILPDVEPAPPESDACEQP